MNRDEEAFGWKPFRVISDYLTQNGIAVLRYDSRGVGGSTGNVYQSTFNDFAEDAIAALHYLKRRKDINPDQIGLCGHSQGGIVAPIVASRSDDVAFIICAAGAGITGEECFITQFGMIDRLDGATDVEITKLTDMRKKLFNLIRKDASQAEINPLLMKIAQIQTEIQGINEDKKREETKESLEEKLSCMLTLFNSPWVRFFLDYDPKAALEKTKCPVLLIFGEMDMQVLVEENREAMVSALMKGGNSDLTVKTFSKANHLFQMAKSGHPVEYTELSKKFVPGFPEFMSDWILQHVDKVK
ncbi:MAG: alpha/beta fold hydrolase [Candidatus Aminicenantes bacterium]|nr:MAG: alpha/beta fold hydrolase [Candidatus Aminicenantes bacterium]